MKGFMVGSHRLYGTLSSETQHQHECTFDRLKIENRGSRKECSTKDCLRDFSETVVCSYSEQWTRLVQHSIAEPLIRQKTIIMSNSHLPGNLVGLAKVDEAGQELAEAGRRRNPGRFHEILAVTFAIPEKVTDCRQNHNI